MMRMLLGRTQLLLLGHLLLLAACGTSQAAKPRAVPPPPPVAVRPPPPDASLYAMDESLRDTLSGAWEYVGTGRWPGINRMQACAFRNARVFVVNVYCSVTEAPAFRLDVYSPTRGRVRIYAEANGPISVRRHEDYFTFTAESEPPPGPETGMEPLSLSMSFEELRAYDERRYSSFLPACHGGTEHWQRRGGCLGPLTPRAPQWAARNRAFLEHASEDWYRVVREMRQVAARYGREPN